MVMTILPRFGAWSCGMISIKQVSLNDVKRHIFAANYIINKVKNKVILQAESLQLWLIDLKKILTNWPQFNPLLFTSLFLHNHSLKQIFLNKLNWHKPLYERWVHPSKENNDINFLSFSCSATTSLEQTAKMNSLKLEMPDKRSIILIGQNKST